MEDRDHNIVSVGYTSETGATQIHIISVIFKTDIDGNQLKLELFGEPFRDLTFKAKAKGIDDELYIVGTIVNDTGVNLESKAWLLKIDSSGNHIWKREFAHYNDRRFEDAYVNNIYRTDNGDLVFCGYLIHASPTKNDAWLVKTDSCGYTEGDESTAVLNIEQVQNKTIDFSSRDSIYCDMRWYFGNGDSSTSANPNYTFSDTGTYTITLITRAGNDFDTASITIVVTEDEIITNTLHTAIKIAFNIMPNPASNFMILKGDIPPVYEQIYFSVYDMIGKEVLQQSFQQGQILQQINVSQWARGMYSYKITANKKLLKAGKVVVER